MKTSELTGAALDWAVFYCENKGTPAAGRDYWPEYSADWKYGGIIIEREKLTVCHDTCIPRWVACDWDARLTEFGTTPLVAAMRCYVVSKLGNDIDVPEGLK